MQNEKCPKTLIFCQIDKIDKNDKNDKIDQNDKTDINDKIDNLNKIKKSLEQGQHLVIKKEEMDTDTASGKNYERVVLKLQ